MTAVMARSLLWAHSRRLRACHVMQGNTSNAAAETLASLRAHFPELQQLFTSLMDAQGNAALSELRTAVADASSEWGLDSEAVRDLIRPESLFTGVCTRGCQGIYPCAAAWLRNPPAK